MTRQQCLQVVRATFVLVLSSTILTTMASGAARAEIPESSCNARENMITAQSCSGGTGLCNGSGLTLP